MLRLRGADVRGLGFADGGGYGFTRLVAEGPSRDLRQQRLVSGFAEEVAGVEVAFAPGFFGGLDKLPVEVAGAEAGGDGLRLGV